jgi:splicing factor 3B subunit 2
VVHIGVRKTRILHFRTRQERMPAVKESKAARRRALKKARRSEVRLYANIAPASSQYSDNLQTPAPSETTLVSESTLKATPEPGSEAETEGGAVQPTPTDDFDYATEDDNPLFSQYKEIFGKFEKGTDEVAAEPDKPEVMWDDDDDIPDEEEEAEQVHKLSKKARKELNKLSIAELKAIVKKPELVEWTDTSASDPRLLVAIKSYRNVVPVPSHWSLKREYLSSKRGIEKPPFALPKFISETGISEMRDAVLEKQAEQSLKSKQRERVQPKMGKLDVDYQKLYDAFFRFQTKPELTRYGEVYYEGKEYETNLKHLRPGELSEELTLALNMQPGMPPPWLINQQRFGTPPSYPALKIAGLNAPIPPGAQWGYHPGGYGKPPVDEHNRPLFGGDIFGQPPRQENQPSGEPVEKTLWGELQPPEEEEEEEEEDDSEEEGDEEEDQDEDLRGMETPAGLQSTVPSEFGGMESVSGSFTLRKQRHGTETEETTGPRSAYQVLPEQAVRAQGFFGSDRKYDLKGTQQAPKNVPMLGAQDATKKRKVGDVDVSVDVDALTRDDKLSKDEIKKKYERERQEQANPWGRVDQDDLTSMIAEESRKRLKKDDERRRR